MNAAVVALIAVVTVWFAGSVLWVNGRIDLLATSLFAISLALMLAMKVNPTWLILACGIAGVAAAHAMR
jgi:hypothetical protein